MRLTWTAPAVRDLSAARTYVASDSPSAAARQMEQVFPAVETLLRLPESGRPSRRPGTRELIVSRTPFVIPYRVRGEVIEALRVLHGRRRWPDSL